MFGNNIKEYTFILIPKLYENNKLNTIMLLRCATSMVYFAFVFKTILLILCKRIMIFNCGGGSRLKESKVSWEGQREKEYKRNVRGIIRVLLSLDSCIAFNINITFFLEVE